MQLDNEKYLKKIELLTKEYHDLRMESAAKLNAHEDKKSRKQATEPMYRPKGSSGPSSEVIDDKAHRQALEFEVDPLEYLKYSLCCSSRLQMIY